jgi:Ribbon-helix-helix protein, copG family
MADKKKAYRRFEQLTRRAMTPTAAENEPDPGTANPWMAAPPLPIRLSPEVRQALEQHAAATDATPSEIVEDALRRYLELPR